MLISYLDSLSQKRKVVLLSHHQQPYGSCGTGGIDGKIINEILCV